MTYLKRIKSPDDLKRLSPAKLSALCSEIRGFLVDSVSKTGGHLASNLGVVELTVALHYCFSSPTDKIIWDVGHQAYVHKLLTGRLKQFNTLRQRDGLSGFPKRCESPHDAFDTGHSSTSVSAGLGYCLSRDLSGAGYKVVSVIGDGSMTGGLVWEAMNNAGKANTDFLVILNDNQMSISKNDSALSKSLTRMRTAGFYLDAKEDVHTILSKVPVIGEKIDRAIVKVKDSIKYLLVPGALFEEMGFTYVGPVDGHDLKELLAVLRQVKNMSGPVLLHVCTVKGKGYTQAEDAPVKYHGVDAFDKETGKPIHVKIWDSYSDVFGKALVKIAEQNSKVVAITAAMPSGTGLGGFQSKFPRRTFDVGIAEGHAVTFAAAMAANGYVPVFAVYSTFLQRAYDQLVHDVCTQNLHVVLAIDRAGIVGADGETHQGVFDISYLSHMPNMTILAPINKTELTSMLEFAVKHTGPVAVRYPRGAASRVMKELTDTKIEAGKAQTLIHGERIAIAALGSMMEIGYEVCQRLQADGYRPTLINPRFVKPLDMDMVQGFANYDYVAVLEENAVIGGLGSLILQQEGVRAESIHLFGLPDQFICHGQRDELLAELKLDTLSIYESIKNGL